MNNETLLNERQTAAYLTVGERCLQSWRVRGFGPNFIKVGRLIRYRKTDIEAFLESQIRKSTSDQGKGL